MSFNDFSELFYENAFVHRHLGKDANEQQALLQTVGFDDLDSFIDAVVPKAVRLNKDLDLPKAMSEHNALAKLRAMADNITVAKSYIGQGYLPAVIQRNVLDTPGCFSAFMPIKLRLPKVGLKLYLISNKFVLT